MKEIQLTQGKVAIVDDEDFERINQYKWYAHFDGWNWYAGRKALKVNNKRTEIKMHRFILNATGRIQVDHKNGNGLDNQKNNIRKCTNQQNQFNKIKPYKNNKLGVKGVRWHKQHKKFQATIQVNKKHKHLGLFTVLAEADQAYRIAEKKYFGEFSRAV